MSRVGLCHDDTSEVPDDRATDGATGGSASSQAADIDRRTWTPRPGLARLTRATVLLGPPLAGFAAVLAAARVVARPIGTTAFVVWLVGLMLLSFVAAYGLQRALRVLAPLRTLFRLSLVFPDQAPSRFSVALRSRTARGLTARLDDRPPTHQSAAEELLALLARLGRHDRLTRGHSERVRAYSVMLGEEIDLSRGDLDRLNWAALIHDIGKLDVPGGILNKEGQPDDDEWRELRKHPAAAAEYVEVLRPWLGDWVSAATQHHERWDGTGYPAGLAGSEIHPAGRIVAIADAYDVMTASRSYKRALPAPQARAELLKSAGTQFEPRLVRAFLQISLGRLQWVSGSIGWFAQLPRFARPPVATMLATGPGVALAVALAAGAVAGGVGNPLEADAGALTVVSPDHEPAAPAQGAGGSAGGERPSTIADEPGRGTVVAPVATTTVPPGREPAPTSTTILAGPGSIRPRSTTTVPAGGSPPPSTVAPSVTTSTAPPVTSTPPPTATTPTTTTARTRPATTTTTTTTPTTTTTSTTTTSPTTTSTTTTTTSTTTTLPPIYEWYQGGPSDTLTTQLPLDAPLATGPLPDYDPFRDAGPGLLIVRGDGITELDHTRAQWWSQRFARATRLTGTPVVDLFVATAGFDVGSSGAVDVGIYRCGIFIAPGNCWLVSSSTAHFDQAASGDDFGRVRMTLPAIDEALIADAYLVLKVAVPPTSGSDIWFAFATTTYPMRLQIF